MLRNDRWRWAAIIALPVAMLLIASVTGCSGDSSRGAVALTSRAAGERTRDLTAEQNATLNSAKQRTKWVGEAHHAAMTVAIAAIEDHRRGKKRLPKGGTPQY